MNTAQQPDVAFLLDVDNTLLDNDHFERDLRAHLAQVVGSAGNDAFWHAFEARRAACQYADYLGALQTCFDNAGRDPRWLQVGHYLLEYPFAQRLFDGALQVLERLAQRGPTWLISDGDGVMQPRKLRRAGLWDAVQGRVRIFIHKQTVLSDIRAACPSAHYVFIDDKPAILDAIKRQWGAQVTTVQPLQGHYALGAPPRQQLLSPDCTIRNISALLDSALPAPLQTHLNLHSKP